MSSTFAKIFTAISIVGSAFGSWNNSVVFDQKCFKNRTFPDAKFASRSLIHPDGSVHDVTIPSAYWASAAISAEIYRILLSEVMGYNTDLTDASPLYSNEILSLVVGCLDQDDEACQQVNPSKPIWHFTVESWNDAITLANSLPQDRQPTLAKTFQYPLVDQYFLLPQVLEAELKDTGCGLDWYRCYDADHYQPHKYFDNWQTVAQMLTKESLAPCSTDPDFYPPLSDQYLQITGDIGSMQAIPGTSSYNVVCHDDTVWFSPACRHNTTLCVPLIVQYDRHVAMQLSVFHNIPLALMQVQSNSSQDYFSTALATRTLFGWYLPDDALIDEYGNFPVLVEWPTNNALEHLQNIWKTGNANQVPANYYWSSLPLSGNSADIISLLKSFDLYNEDMTNLMIQSRITKDQGMDRFASARKVACDWLQANEARWQLWIPLRCDPGEYPSPSRTCEPCPAGSSCAGNTLPILCASGFYCPAGSPKPIPCPLGTEHQQQGASDQTACTACKPGYIKTEIALGNCVPCALGFYCPANASSPQLCAPGTYSDEAGLVQCKVCPKGFIAKSNGQANCLPCPAGSYQSLDGQFECDYCLSGTFSDKDAATVCTTCPFSNAITASVGSHNVLDCGCKAGFYHPCYVVNNSSPTILDNASCSITNSKDYYSMDSKVLASFCQECPDEGMDCPGGLSGLFHVQPIARTGFALRTSEPYGSYLCQDSDEIICPGGGPGFCGAGRDGDEPSCAICPPGHFQIEESCSPCTSSYQWYDILAVIVICGAWMLMSYRGSGMDIADKIFADVICAAAIILETLSVVHIISSNSKTSANSPLGVLSVILDSVLSQFSVVRPSCNMGRSIRTRYLSPIGLFLAMIGLAWIAHHGRALLRFDKELSIAKMINFFGLMISGFYILISKSIVVIFECRDNPNGLQTMENFPDVVCSGSDRISLLPIAYALVVIIVVGTGIWFAVAVYLAPKYLDKHEFFTTASLFLFEQYKRERYYFAVLLMLRSLLISLTSVIFPGSIVAQTAFLTCILSISIINTLVQRPYHSALNDLLDAVLCLLLMWLTLANGFYVALTNAADHSLPFSISSLLEIGSMTVYAIIAVSAVALAVQVYIVMKKLRELPPEECGDVVLNVMRRLSVSILDRTDSATFLLLKRSPSNDSIDDSQLIQCKTDLTGRADASCLGISRVEGSSDSEALTQEGVGEFPDLGTLNEEAHDRMKSQLAFGPDQADPGTGTGREGLSASSNLPFLHRSGASLVASAELVVTPREPAANLKSAGEAGSSLHPVIGGSLREQLPSPFAMSHLRLTYGAAASEALHSSPQGRVPPWQPRPLDVLGSGFNSTAGHIGSSPRVDDRALPRHGSSADGAPAAVGS